MRSALLAAVCLSACQPVGTWSLLPTNGAPAPRMEHAAVVVDNQLVVWGGSSAPGGRIDLDEGVWRSVSEDNAPSSRLNPRTVVVDGKLLIVGPDRDEPALYDPIADVWTRISTDNAPAPAFLPFATAPAVAAFGRRVLMWGARDLEFEGPGVGGVYDLDTDAWTTMTTEGAPPLERAASTAVVVDDKIVIFSGASGGVYDPDGDSWTAISKEGAPPSPAIASTAREPGVVFCFDTVNDDPRLFAYEVAADAWSTRPISVPGRILFAAGDTLLLERRYGELTLVDPAAPSASSVSDEPRDVDTRSCSPASDGRVACWGGAATPGFSLDLIFIEPSGTGAVLDVSP